MGGMVRYGQMVWRSVGWVVPSIVPKRTPADAATGVEVWAGYRWDQPVRVNLPRSTLRNRAASPLTAISLIIAA